MLFLFLLLSFIQVGLLGIGGTPSAQSLLEHEVITLHHWLSPAQMADLMVFCRALPGGTSVNTATLVGATSAFARYGVWGSLCASVLSLIGLIIPSSLWTMLYTKLQEKREYQSFYNCAMVVLRPLVPGLIAAASIILMRAENFGSLDTTPWEFGVSVFLFLSTLIGVGVYKFNALFMVVLCGIAGLLLY